MFNSTRQAYLAEKVLQVFSGYQQYTKEDNHDMAWTLDMAAMEALEIMKRAVLIIEILKLNFEQSSAFPRFSNLQHPGVASHGRGEVTNDRFSATSIYFFKRR